jgi:hypothetical protein
MIYAPSWDTVPGGTDPGVMAEHQAHNLNSDDYQKTALDRRYRGFCPFRAYRT